jgi:hypothetical protein
VAVLPGSYLTQHEQSRRDSLAWLRVPAEAEQTGAEDESTALRSVSVVLGGGLVAATRSFVYSSQESCHRKDICSRCRVVVSTPKQQDTVRVRFVSSHKSCSSNPVNGEAQSQLPRGSTTAKDLADITSDAKRFFPIIISYLRGPMGAWIWTATRPQDTEDMGLLRSHVVNSVDGFTLLESYICVLIKNRISTKSSVTGKSRPFPTRHTFQDLHVLIQQMLLYLMCTVIKKFFGRIRSQVAYMQIHTPSIGRDSW